VQAGLGGGFSPGFLSVLRPRHAGTKVAVGVAKAAQDSLFGRLRALAEATVAEPATATLPRSQSAAAADGCGTAADGCGTAADGCGTDTDTGDGVSFQGPATSPDDCGSSQGPAMAGGAMLHPRAGTLRAPIRPIRWGSVLDSGTGDHSLQWILSLGAARWTAVTADGERHAGMITKFAGAMRPADRILLGNWLDPGFLIDPLSGQPEVFDFVIEDYLLGAVEGFAPYFQNEVFARIRPHVGRALLLVGLEP
jgi:hypothetical protein